MSSLQLELSGAKHSSQAKIPGRLPGARNLLEGLKKAPKSPEPHSRFGKKKKKNPTYLHTDSIKFGEWKRARSIFEPITAIC